MGKRVNQFKKSLRDNMQALNFYGDRLKELAISMFEWENMPKEIDTRYLESYLFSNGAVVFFYDEELEQYLCLPVLLNGKWNVYNIPITRRAYASNGYQKDLTEDNSVIIYNNMLRTNSIDVCRIYSEKLYDLDQSIIVNAKAQKTPILIQATEQQRLTMLNLYKEYDGNQPFIFGDKNLDLNGVKSITTGAPYVADRMQELKTQIWNEALTYLGISNIAVTKKERMLTDEIQRNLGGTMASRYSRMNTRQQAVNKINEMFNLDIKISFRDDTPIEENETPEKTVNESGVDWNE